MTDNNTSSTVCVTVSAKTIEAKNTDWSEVSAAEETLRFCREALVAAEAKLASVLEAKCASEGEGPFMREGKPVRITRGKGGSIFVRAAINGKRTAKKASVVGSAESEAGEAAPEFSEAEQTEQ